jgi:phytoene dehydrogenase-like protein
VNEKIKDFYDNYEIFSSLVQVSLGVSRTFAGFPHAFYFPLEEPFIIDNQASIDWIGVQVFNFDPTLAPKGHTVITCLLPTYNYRYWQDLRNNDNKKYKTEKERIADRIIDILEKKFGAIKANVTVVDVATPATFIRYTNNWKGSFEGWLLTPAMGMKQIPRVLPGLTNFHMIGQWVEPGGGLPTVLLSGRNIAQVICKKDKRDFITR